MKNFYKLLSFISVLVTHQVVFSQNTWSLTPGTGSMSVASHWSAGIPLGGANNNNNLAFGAGSSITSLTNDLVESRRWRMTFTGTVSYQFLGTTPNLFEGSGPAGSQVSFLQTGAAGTVFVNFPIIIGDNFRDFRVQSSGSARLELVGGITRKATPATPVIFEVNTILGTAVIGGDVTDNGSAKLGIRKTGGGFLLISDNKDYTGETLLNTGTTQVVGNLKSERVVNSSTLLIGIDHPAEPTIEWEMETLELKAGSVLNIASQDFLLIKQRLIVEYADDLGPNVDDALQRIKFAPGATLEYRGGNLGGYARIENTFWPTADGPTNVVLSNNMLFDMRQADPLDPQENSRILPGNLTIETGSKLILPHVRSYNDLAAGDLLTVQGAINSELDAGEPIHQGTLVGGRFSRLFLSRTADDLSPNTESNLYFEQDAEVITPEGDILKDGNHIFDFNISRSHTAILRNRLNVTDGPGNYGGDPNATVDDFLGAAPQGVGLLSIQAGGDARLVTNDNLYFLSTRNGTSIFGQVNSNLVNNAIVGNFYTDIWISYAAGLNPINDGRSWRLWSFPVKGSRTLGQTLQSDGSGSRTLISNTEIGGPNNGAPIPAQPATYGTIVTGHQFPNATQANQAGYDFWSGIANRGQSSIRGHRFVGGEWTWPSNLTRIGTHPTYTFNMINQTLDQKESAYFLFIRGDRRRTVPNTNAADTAIIRMFGSAEQVNFSIPVKRAGLDGPDDLYQAFGNPYFAPIDILQYNGSGLPFISKYWWWNPRLGERGGYELLSLNFAGTGFTNPANQDVPNARWLKAGQAIIFERRNNTPFNPGVVDEVNLNILEQHKTTSRLNVAESLNPFEGSTADAIIGITMNWVGTDSKLYPIESAGARFNETYTLGKDDFDSRKLSNVSSSWGFGLERDGKINTVEALPLITGNDTLHFRTLGMFVGSYNFTFRNTNMEVPGIEAFLHDKFMNTFTPIELSQPEISINFSVTSNSESSKPDRFSLIFQKSTTLPVTFTDISVVEKSGDASVNWSTATERGVRHFEVEYSPNGRDFARVGTVAAQNTATAQYNYLHSGIGEGKHFYRVRSVDLDGKTALTRVVNVEIGKGIEGFGVYPTVITEGSVTLRLNSLPKGRYNVQVTDMSGKVMMAAPLQHNGGTANQTMRLPAMSNGAYNVRLQGDNGQTYIQRVMKQ